MIYQYNDTPIFYTINGKGPVWVLLHGFLENAKIWDTIIKDFSNSHMIITIDLPGHGNSGFVSDIHTMELMAKIVLDILEHLGITNATFIGHSMGGYVCLACIEKHSEIVDKVVLINSIPSEDSEDRKVHRERTLKIVEKNKEAFVQMAISNLFTERSRKKYDLEIRALKKQALTISLENLKASIIGMGIRKDRVEVLKNFQKPKYMISGIEDPIMPIQQAESLSQKTNTTLYKLEEGHMSWLENGKKLTTLLRFIDK
ncbi:alpha/beta fold hydrolase [Jejudonia soesokkakensis]|uniref:Alpha/beta fold hydrolase n=1 Tax=Jejudonia soesokkakensis TaxID=1323432 RepID=A0ABW2MRL3_9FLAO